MEESTEGKKAKQMYEKAVKERKGNTLVIVAGEDHRFTSDSNSDSDGQQTKT